MASTIRRRSYGQNCEAGWGYDGENGVFIENPEFSGRVIFSSSIFPRTKEFNVKAYNFFTFVSYPYLDTSFIESLVGRNENACKYMDFIIQNSKTNGFISEILAVTKFSEISDPLASYPTNATHYVKKVYHGLQMFVIFNKRNIFLFENGDDDGKFLNKIWRQQTPLSDEQKKILCSVLIFSSNHEKTIIKEMTINEIRELLSNVENGEYSDFVGSVHYILESMSNSKVSVISENVIKIIEKELFSLYRKRKLLDKELDLLESSSNLKKSSAEFNEKKKQLESSKSTCEELWDIFLKNSSKLFQRSKLTNLELNSNAPVNEPVKIKSKFQTESIAKKIKPKFCSMMNDQIIMMGKDYFYSLDPEMTKKLKMGVFLSNEDDEPFISNKNLDRKILIGFASHQNEFTDYDVETTEMFVSRCPKNCTRDDRQWICVTCGNFFKAKNFEVVCDCGTTHVTNLKLECFDPRHPKTFLPSLLNSCSTSGISTPRTVSSPTFE